jgi:hypothetical protein|tara:strand:+ start:3917 stop:4540 length:624 start_codon:yes stop_codon:yes gene_type:complete
MSNKLQNVKAIKQMLVGEHRTQTSKTIYTGKTKSKETEIVESFDDGKPRIWIEIDNKGFRTRVTQHDGFTTRQPENSILKKIQEKLKVPEKCPSCGKNMRDHEKKLNFKFYFKRGKCFDCVLKEEQKIKQQGIEAWDQYQKEIMSSNAEAWFKDTDKEVEIVKQQVRETTWENADGERSEIDISSFIERMENDYKQLKKDVLSSFDT